MFMTITKKDYEEESNNITSTNSPTPASSAASMAPTNTRTVAGITDKPSILSNLSSFPLLT